MAEQIIGGTSGARGGNQTEADGLRNIEARADAQRVSEQKTDPEQWVKADLRDFERLQEHWQQVHAGVAMAGNGRGEPGYKAALANAAPDMLQRVQQLDDENNAKTLEKDERKSAEYAELKRDRAEAAQSWSPEQAAELAAAHAKELQEVQNVTERHFVGEDMAVNARNSPAYRAALEVHAPDVAKELVERHRNAMGESAPSNSWKDYSATDDALDRAAAGLPPNPNWAASAKVTAGTSTAVEAASFAPKDASEEARPVGRQEAANDAASGPSLAIDSATMQRLQQVRMRDSQQAAEALGINGIEPASDRRRLALEAEQQSERQSALRRANEAQLRPGDRQRSSSDNKVESDEVFTATKDDRKAVIPPEVERQYRRDGSKYYELAKPEVVAFEDKGNKLETRSNSEQVAENLVRIAKARGWDEIKVSGSETFRKEAWLEAAANGMHVKGYTPSEADKETLAKRSPTEGQRVENEGKPFRGREAEAVAEQVKETTGQARARAFATEQQADAVKAHPELAGAYVATAAVERKVDADGLTPQQRAVVASRVRQNVVNAIERGSVPEAQLNERTEIRRERDRHDEREVSR